MVLFVDDNFDNCRPFAVYLQRNGIDVQWAASGADALSLVQRHTPALIVMDEMMPDMTGRDTVQRLRQRPELARTPVIFFTGSTLQLADVADLGVTALFRKASADVADVCSRMLADHDAGLRLQRNPA